MEILNIPQAIQAVSSASPPPLPPPTASGHLPPRRRPPLAPDERNDFLRGPFFQEHRLLWEVGRGSYGSVFMGFRKRDLRLAVTKFVVKSKVHSWCESPGGSGRLPAEIHWLTRLDEHPNVIRVLDYFEGPGCYQLVMEKHGAGMDLFEFVDREPKMDEPLASYIYRQVRKLTYLWLRFKVF